MLQSFDDFSQWKLLTISRRYAVAVISNERSEETENPITPVQLLPTRKVSVKYRKCQHLSGTASGRQAGRTSTSRSQRNFLPPEFIKLERLLNKYQAHDSINVTVVISLH
ncbi:hypothetical protein AVEN_111604-1 [Araneus ventricosus]|uniref:Uncharacterized protein n=1 Tax=Araneus ventricosus TaxID=182803 RepID=A0A4Y2C590_ARAVE|nr:hypothetical protein AVEN_111604-1 [Araneus ventricosus]